MLCYLCLKCRQSDNSLVLECGIVISGSQCDWGSANRQGGGGGRGSPQR